MSIYLGDPGPLSYREQACRILGLSGGGIRGLFTARVLERLEAAAGRPCNELFDVIAGTSVGGIIALGLSKGIPAKSMRELISRHGPRVFSKPASPWAGWIGPRYPVSHLRAAVEEILGSAANETLSTIDVPVLVITVDQTSGLAQVLKSRGLAAGEAADVSLLDAALATSAAPTYFLPHRYGGRTYVDGGLAANVPDLVAVTECIQRFGTPLEKVYLLSVGTAAGQPFGPALGIGAPGRLRWLFRHRLFELAISAQGSLAHVATKALLPGRILAIDSMPPGRIPLDAADAETMQRLHQLADDAIEITGRDDRELWTFFTAGRRNSRLVEKNDPRR